MFKAIKLRLYPNSDQEQLLAKTCGCQRFVYNYFLAKAIKDYRSKGKQYSAFDMNYLLPSLRQEFEFLQEVDITALRSATSALASAYKNFFRRVKQGGAPGFPKFKRKGVNDRFTVINSLYLDLERRSLKVGKCGWIKVRSSTESLETLNQAEKIKSITVSRDGTHWYASCLIEVEDPGVHIHKHFKCGIDVGVARPVVVSYIDEDTGEVLTKSIGREFSKALLKKEQRRKKYQRALARKTKGSSNRNKAKLKVANAYRKERSFRRDFVEKVSCILAATFEVVKFENLKVQDMTKKGKHKHGLNREMLRLGIGQLMTRTEQKAIEKGGQVIYVDPRNTSRRCSACGFTSKDNRKSQADFKCCQCGHSDNADTNASMNILFKEAA